MTRALPATLALALIWPAVAAASPVTESLEADLARLPNGAEVKLIVSLDRAATAGRVRGLERAVGDMDVKQRFGIVDAVALTAKKEQVRDLAAQGIVDRIEEDRLVNAADPPFGGFGFSPAQTSFGVAKARLDWDPNDPDGLEGDADGDPSTYSSNDLVAAVIDTGVDADHDALDGEKVLAFVDCTTGPCEATDPYDDSPSGHGTHVAATIAGSGEGDPDTAVPGVAPGAALVGVKVLQGTVIDPETKEVECHDCGHTSDVIKGIEWVSGYWEPDNADADADPQWVAGHKDEYGVEAINLSLGSDLSAGDAAACRAGQFAQDVPAASRAANIAWGVGLVVTVAAGNEGPSTCTIGAPGDAKDVITVGAMADLGANGFTLAGFSGRGPTVDGRIKPDLTAPGVGILSAEAGTAAEYSTLSGTSMATPFVTGVALLMKDAEPSLLADEIKDTLRGTAVDWGRGDTNVTPGSSGPDADYGAGRLAGYAAIAAADAFVDGETTLAGPPAPPQHAMREGSLAGTGEVLEYSVDVPDLRFPLAATMIEVPTNCRAGANPDFDLRLTAPDGTVVAAATSSQRQDELGHQPTAIGVYKLRVYSFQDCGDFFVDVSGGAVQAVGTSNPDPVKPAGPPPTVITPTPAPTPPRSVAPDDSAAFAAVANAARITARRATSRVRKVGLRRLLRRGRFTFAGRTYGAGKVQLAIRMRHRGRKVLVARATRHVSKAGKPRVNVRLTRAGRRLLRRVRRSTRLTVRAAVTDASMRRRYVDVGARVRR